MNDRIKDKITEINIYLEELESIRPQTLKQYIKDLKGKAASERYVEKIMEAVVDLAFHAIKLNHLPVPEDDSHAFEILRDAKIIDQELTRKLQEAKGMRNIIAHQYGEIDDTIIFHAIEHEIRKDVQEFIIIIENYTT